MSTFSQIFRVSTGNIESLVESPEPVRRTEQIFAAAATNPGLGVGEAASLIAWGRDSERRSDLHAAAQRIRKQLAPPAVEFVIPVYLTSFCENECLYCGYRHSNPLAERVRLSLDDFGRELDLILSWGHRQIELVLSEDPEFGPEVVARYVDLTRRKLEEIGGGAVALCSPVYEREDYVRLRNAGLEWVVEWQETYHQPHFDRWHVFFGCAGPHLRNARVDPVVRSEDLAVVGIVEVISHLPRIWSRFRQLIDAAGARQPSVAILTDSPDFHLRAARKLKRLGIPVVYLVAPQVWAWRQGRVKTMRRVIDRLLCIFPFEEAWFRERGVPVTYIGHPLANRCRPSLTREEFFRKHNLPLDRPLITVLPGSRRSEALRHVPALVRATTLLARDRALTFILPASPTCGADFFAQPLAGSPIRAIEGDAWDAMAHCDVALTASGTVTVEAALLGAPMVVFYRVTALTWHLGRHLVDVPYFSMVNLIAGKRVVPELIQDDMTAERIAAETARLLDNASERCTMKEELARVAARLNPGGQTDAIARAAVEVERLLEVSK